jgi:hypothetical protein
MYYKSGFAPFAGVLRVAICAASRRSPAFAATDSRTASYDLDDRMFSPFSPD